MKQAGSSTENKMVGTISNKINKMSRKEKDKRRRERLSNLSEGEIAIMKKYGTYDTVMIGIKKN